MAQELSGDVLELGAVDGADWAQESEDGLGEQVEALVYYLLLVICKLVFPIMFREIIGKVLIHLLLNEIPGLHNPLIH